MSKFNRATITEQTPLVNPLPRVVRDRYMAWPWQRHAWRDVAGPVVLVAALYSLLVVARLVLHHGDPSAFVAAGDLFADPARVPSGLHVLTSSSGYDGQAYYRLALDPWTGAINAYGVHLDNPAYRQQRILYPLLAWATSLGQPAFVPAALIAINLVGLGALAGLGAALARSYGRPTWWGVVPALYPGFLVTLALDLTEIVEAAFLLACLLLWRRHRPAGVAVGLTLAILARETALLVPVAMAVAWLFDRIRRRQSQLSPGVFLPPIAVYLLWQGWLWSRWHTVPFRGNSGNIGVPFLGLARFIGSLAPASRPADLLWLLEMAALVLFGLVVLAALRVRGAPPWLVLAWWLATLLSISLGTSVWLEDIGFLRALTDWYVLGAVLLMLAGGKRQLLLVAPSFALWAWMWLAMAWL